MALPEELRHLVDWNGAEPDAAGVRIECASLLGWLGGRVIGMYSQLEDSRRHEHMADHTSGSGVGGGDSRRGTVAGPGSGR